MTEPAPDAPAPLAPRRPLAAGVRRMVTARPWATAVVVVVVAGTATGVFLLRGGSGTAAAGAAVTTRLVAASTGTVQASVSATGSITAADTEDLSFGSTAEVTSVRVAQGDRVVKGQVLGTIDTLALKASVADAQSVLANAQSQLTTAEDTSATTSAQLAADKATVSTDTSAVTAAQQALAAATLTSPIAGVVAEVNVAKGDEAGGGSSSASASGASGSGSSGSGSSGSGSSGSGSSGSGSGAGTTRSSGTTGTSTTAASSADFVVVGGKRWTVSVDVDDTQVGLIAKGDQVQLTTDNVTGLVFGTVSSVSVLSSSTSGSASYPVDIAITGSPAGLHDGASATASIIYKQVTGVVTVPTAAVHASGTSGTAASDYVLVSSGGTKVRKTVTTGLASGGLTQITSGLTAGTEVYEQVVSRPASTSTNRGTGQRGGGGYFPGGGGGYFPGGGGAGGAGGGVPGGFGGGNR